MKKFYALFITVLTLFVGTIYGTTHTIVNVGTTFSPDSITINAGDQITFTLGSIHNVVEVNKSVWDANGNTSNGGFSLGFGGGTLTFNTPGTFYYVCAPHASLGMKGKIIVLAATGIPVTKTENDIILKAYPNPATSFLNVDFFVPQNSRIKLDLIDMTGRVVGNLLSTDYVQGNYKITLSLANYSAGRYFVRYTYGEAFSVKPIIIMHLR
jgi:plastocyanin